MIANPARKPFYRPSRGQGEFRLPSGQEVLICADDEKVEAEIKRRNLSATVQQNAVLGRSFVLAHPTPLGMDLFVWIGNAEDGGLVWFSLPGAKKIPPEVLTVIAGAIGGPAAGFGGGFSYGLS